jgi:anti-anti-sigma factor
VALRAWIPRGEGLEKEAWDRRHRLLLAIVWAHVVVLPFYAALEGRLGFGTALDIACLAILALVANVHGLSRRVRACFASTALVTCSALVVHLSGGRIEAHFHFFVVIGLLVLYQDWVPYLLAVAYVAFEHGVIGAYDPKAVYATPDAWSHPWRWALIHALFVFAASCANIIAWKENERLGRRVRRAEAEQAELRARSELADRVMRLQSATEALARATTLHDVAAAMIEHGVRGIGAGSGAVLVRLDDGQLSVVALDGMPADVASRYRRLTASARTLAADAVLRGEPLSLGSLDEAEETYPELAGTLDLAAALALPLMLDGEAIGAFVVHFRDRRTLRPDERAYLDALARLCVHAFERTRLYERARFAASELQHALLPSRLPAIPGVTLATRYLPSSAASDVGGDWFDVLPLRSGRIGVVVGDVFGRGLSAAARMGQFRNALRAYLFEDELPGQALARLARLAHAFDDGPPATIVCAVFDPHGGSLSLASAGHLPPLLLRPDGTSELLEIAPGPPVGSFAPGEYAERGFSLEAGDTLVLYSDGVVEERGVPLDVGFERLRTVGGHAATLDVDALAGRLLAAAPMHHDDQTLVALRAATHGVFHLALPARPSSVGRARHALEDWVEAQPQKLTREQASDVLLAVSEACANTVLHAYDLEEGELRAEASFDARGLVVRIADDGRWRPARDDEHGRGMMLMRGLVDELEVRPDARGTEVVLRKLLAAAPASTPEAEPLPLPARREHALPRVTVERRGAVVLVELAGELEVGGIDVVRAELAELELAETAGIVVDLGDCTFLDSTGIGLLFHVAARTRERRRRLVVVAPPEHHRVLELVALDRSCLVVQTRAAAIAAFEDLAVTE